jgi:hypothetical protein
MREEETDACFLMRGAGSCVEHVMCHLAVDDRWVSNLLESNDIQ